MHQKRLREQTAASQNRRLSQAPEAISCGPSSLKFLPKDFLTMIAERRIRSIALALILLIALAWRLNNISFGLPNMWDPDEPIFMLIPLDMLRHRTLNPGWFGHPGSTTIYLVACIDLVVAALGAVTGRYPNSDAFAQAAFNDPAMLVIPARTAMVLIGVGTVWLTYKVGRKLGGTSVGLVAALLLAINPLHIGWSQVVRTDIEASLFMLASIVFCIRVAERGRLSDYLVAGAFAGLATVTKWPAATILIALVGAAASRGFNRSDLQKLTLAGAAWIGAMFFASPFIFIDWRAVLADVSGEAAQAHLGHTSAGFLSNLQFYIIDQLGGSMGWIGLVAVVAGAAILVARSRVAGWTLAPSAAAFLLVIASQHLAWSRWLLPLLPAFSIFAAVAIERAGSEVARVLPRIRIEVAVGLTFLLAASPSLAGAIAQATERANDTRVQADRWAVRHIPPGSTIVLEHLELGLRGAPWKLLFPVGISGCIDAVKALKGGLDYRGVKKMRGSGPIADLGNVSPERLATCHANYAILTYYDLYRTEAGRFPQEIRNYHALLAGARTVALFAPEPGRVGGPIVRIVFIPPQ
jgi:hypothetical protein